jgi:hypothetical protein
LIFQSQYLINFETSNKIIWKGRFRRGSEIFMFFKRGHGLGKFEKHCLKTMKTGELEIRR